MIHSPTRLWDGRLGLIVTVACCLTVTGCREHKQLDAAAALSQDGGRTMTHLADYYGRLADHVRDQEQMSEIIALENVPPGSVDRALDEVKRLHDLPTPGPGLPAPGGPPPTGILGVPPDLPGTLATSRKSAEVLAADFAARQQMALAVADLYATLHDVVTLKPDDAEQSVLNIKSAAEKLNHHPLHVGVAGHTLPDDLVTSALRSLTAHVIDTRKLHDAREANTQITAILTDMDTVYQRESRFYLQDETAYDMQSFQFTNLMSQAGVADPPDPRGTIEAVGEAFRLKANGTVVTPEGRNVLAAVRHRSLDVTLDSLLAASQSESEALGDGLSQLLERHHDLAKTLK